MNSNTYCLAKKCFVVLLGIASITVIQEIECSPSPQNKRGGSRRGNSQGYGKYDEKAFQEQIKAGYESKSSSKLFAKKNWQSAIAFEPGANISSQTSEEMQNAFSSNKYLDGKVDFEDWKDLMEQDGMLCRDDKDCIWYDPGLGCNDREFNVSRANANWPWKDDLKGRCTCQNGLWFDSESGKCDEVKINWLYTLFIIGCILGSCFFCSCVCHIILRITRKLDLGQSDI